MNSALDSDRFKQFLDHVPVAIAVSELLPSEKVTYANLEFEQLTGHPAEDMVGLPDGVTWPAPGKLGAAIARSLGQNARAEFTVESAPGAGTAVRIFFPRTAAGPSSD